MATVYWLLIPSLSLPLSFPPSQEGGFDMWPSTCQQVGVPALDPDHPYHTHQPLAAVDERQDFLLLERIWR